MSSLHELVRDYLAADVELAALLTGGMYVGLEITRQKTPAAFDANGEVKPCALVRDGSLAPVEPHPDGARAYVDIFLYQYQGIETIAQARQRIYRLLHRQKAGILGVWEIRHANDVPVIDDPALGCNLAMSQYSVAMNREVTG